MPTIYALKYDVIQILQGQKQYTIDRLNTNDHALEAAYCLEGDNHLVVTPNGFSLIHEKSSAVYERTVPALTLYTEDYKKNVLFAVKNDGSVFFLEDVNGQGLIVDMVSDTVAVAKTAPSGFQKPIRVLNSSTVEIPGGQSRNPVINGKRVRFPLNNPATCYTIMPNGDVAFGSFFFLAGYSSDGTIKWVDITFAPTLAVVPIDEGRRIVSLSADGTVRWHDGTNGETLLASYVHPDLKRRVTWTPEGFFDHSAGGESLVGFHHNQGAGRQARFYSIERFYENLYRPDLVRARLLGKSEDGIIKARKEVGEILDMLEKGLPPEVSASCVVRDGVLNVDVSIEDGGSGVGPVSYFLNGVKVAEDAPPAVSPVKGKRYALTKQLVTAPGENVIEVRSESPLSHIESNTARVVLTNTFAAERKKTLYVLAVGIDKYAAKEFVLNNAVNDVRYFSSTISEIAHKRFADVIVETVENSQATTANVLKAISSVGGRTSPDDCFVLYLSGHGLTVDNTYYFLPSELQGFTKESVALNAISQQALNKALLSVAAQESLIILDTCQSGSFAFSSPLGLDMKAATGRLNRATGRAVLTAATASGDALEGFKGHGLFTYVLVDGLQGKADAAFEDESVSLVELGDYILNNVPTLSSEVWGVTQRPIFYHKGNDFTLTSTER
ncbi:hypothetical protein JCM14722_29940 [Pseudodesulfovibrio portus]|uniref:Peptidase C14 caspase domain-containing protein n=1 Tax=Pseudodesulfovibrio portus TaxID=231439 RepID=A0ABM8AVF7_9BACT|nr:hypothetical protein JCM14722_29940 [Pseudodesulfovibrio portus]